MRSMEAELKTLRQEIATRNEKAANNNQADDVATAEGDSSSSDDVTPSQLQSQIKMDGKNDEDAEKPSKSEDAEMSDDERSGAKDEISENKGEEAECDDEEKVTGTNNNKESKMTKRRRIK